MRRTVENIRRFRLSDSFIEPYVNAEVPWGPLGYITFKRTYARRLSETEPGATGTEEWFQTCRRVIEGMFDIQKEHVVRLGLEWNDNKAQKTAKDAYDRLFNLKWTPPGRGLWMMGTKFTNDTLVIDDSREGWVNSVHILLDGFLFGSNIPKFDYSALRPEGAIIHGFGGTSSGAGPLIELHDNLKELFSSKVGELITSVDIVDIENLIGRCVVSGNVRRSAALALGEHDDFRYLEMKNDQEKLYHHRWGSNNSYAAHVGMEYGWHANQTQENGEPGTIWLENARAYGRFKDGVNYDDAEVVGFNPCVEQSLHNAEMCCLVETFPAKHDDYEDYVKTLKCAYLYGKTVTLVNTHWPETNAKMLKNRRIGLSQSGIIQAFKKHGRRNLLEWSDQAYDHVRKLDTEYSNWLCVPRSIKVTSIKPSGTVSLLNGSTPGIHFPEDEYYIRRIRFSKTSSMLTDLEKAGYHIEDDAYSPNTSVVEFPVKEEHFTKGKKDVSMWEIAAQYQHYWADNAVSVTITFNESESQHIQSALEMYETRLKAVSFLKLSETGYKQAPYEPITKEQYEEMSNKVTPIHRIKTETAGSGTKYCDGDQCEI